MSPRPQMQFRTRLQIISDAVERAAQSAEPDDVAYLVEHLLFEAGLLIRSGVFTHEPTNVAIERALKTATQRAKRLKQGAREVPSDFPVKVLRPGTKAYANAKDRALCYTCGRAWDDAVVTGYTPAPSARCPFEAFHGTSGRDV